MTESKKKSGPSVTMKFEEAFENLEAIVEKLERGELMLDDALKEFEEGVALIKICTNRLNEAEARLQKLMESEDGTFRLESME